MWVVEVKADRDADNAEVEAKKQAARTWVNHLTVNRQPGVDLWRYLFVTETDLEQAHDDWVALVGLARGWD